MSEGRSVRSHASDRRGLPRRVARRGAGPACVPSTWVNYRDYLDAYVIPVIGDSRLQDLTPVRLNLLYSHLLETGRVKRPGGLAPKTVQNVHRMLHRALRDGVKWDLIPRNDAEDASPPRARRASADHLDSRAARSVRQARRGRSVLRAVAARRDHRAPAGRARRASPHRHRSRARARVSQRPAGRGRRACRRVGDEDRSGERSLALDPTTSEALRDYLIAWDKERVPARAGHATALRLAERSSRCTPTPSRRSSTGTARRAGLPRIRLHDVRHSYATAALKAGIPPKIISERLGHATAAFTLQTYTHVIPGMDEGAANTVADLILADDSERRWTHIGTH